MPFEDTPSPPIQAHPVRLRPPSLRGLSIWAYLALAFVIISTIAVLCYAGYSCYYSLRLKATTPLPQYFNSPSKAKRPKKKRAWRPSKLSSSQQQPMLSDMSVDHNSTYKFDCRMSLIPLAVHIPPVTFPSTAVSPPAKSRTIPTYDMHNIRFASPSNMDIYTNPKLAPVLGSAIPLSYDSQNNLFGNLFTPTTTPSRKVGTGQRKASGFGVKGKCRSSQAGKENCKEAEAVPWNYMY